MAYDMNVMNMNGILNNHEQPSLRKLKSQFT